MDDLAKMESVKKACEVEGIDPLSREATATVGQHNRSLRLEGWEVIQQREAFAQLAESVWCHTGWMGQ